MPYTKEGYRSSNLWKKEFLVSGLAVGIAATEAAATTVRAEYAATLEAVRTENPVPVAEQISPLRGEGITATEGRLALTRQKIQNLRNQAAHAVSIRVEAVKRIDRSTVLGEGTTAAKKAGKEELLRLATKYVKGDSPSSQKSPTFA